MFFLCIFALILAPFVFSYAFIVIFEYMCMYEIYNHISTLSDCYYIPYIDNKDIWAILAEHIKKEFDLYEFSDEPEKALLELELFLSTKIHDLMKRPDIRDKYNRKRTFWDYNREYVKPLVKKSYLRTYECDTIKAREYLKQLYSNVSDVLELPESEKPKILHSFNIQPIDVNDVSKAFNSVNDSHDPYGLYYRVIYNLPFLHGFIASKYMDILRKCENGEEIGIEWFYIPIISKHKSGDKTDPRNYRPIIMMTIMMKSFHKIISARIYDYCVSNMLLDTNIQKGLQKSVNGVCENNLICKNMINSAHLSGKPLCMLFLDIENAYGSISHDFINKTLEFYQIPENIRKYLGSLYKNNVMSIAANGGYGDVFRWRRGIFQGCAVSNVIFVICIGLLLSELNKSMDELGYSADFGKVFILTFIDDIVLVSDDITKLQTAIDRCIVLLNIGGLKLKPSKCRLLRINCIGDIDIGGSPVKLVDNSGEFKYLGTPITECNDEEKIFECFKEELIQKLEYIDKIDKPQIRTRLYMTYVSIAVSWKFVNSIWSDTIRNKIEEIELNYLQRWGIDSNQMLHRRREMVNRRHELITRISADYRIQNIGNDKYGPIGSDVSLDDIRAEMEKSREAPQYYSSLNE